MELKRAVDLIVAVPLFVLSLPLQLVIAFAILVTMGRPVFYLQKRPGLHGFLFTLVKFRTMRPAGPSNIHQLSRVTRMGMWLRKSSLDEIPELLNVIKGDMSLVGPRPLLRDYVPLYTAEQSRRHDVRPGITGLAQVNGRNCLSWRRKFKYDVWYAKHHSFWLDLRILCLTAIAMFRTSHVNQSDTLTMEPFSGNDR